MSRQEDTSGGMTQLEVAKVLGVSVQYVSQLERKALAKLKNRGMKLQRMKELADMLEKSRADSNIVRGNGSKKELL